MHKAGVIAILFLTSLILSCTVPSGNAVNNPPNPPILPAYDNVTYNLYTLSPTAIKILNLSYASPADPDSGDTVSMKIVAVNMVDYTTHLISGPLDAELAATDPRFTDSVTGTFQIDGLSATIHGNHSGEAIGVEVCVEDNHGDESETVMVVIYINGS